MGLLSFVIRVAVPEDHSTTKQEEFNAVKRRLEYLKAYSDLLDARLSNHLETRYEERAGGE